MSWPVVGGDYRSWGQKLLAILQSTHNEDGGLKDAIVADVVDEAALRTADLVTGGLASHVTNVDNPHGVTAAQVGLGNVGGAYGIVDSDGLHPSPVIGQGWYANALAGFVMP